jgi:hypothetical protein
MRRLWVSLVVFSYIVVQSAPVSAAEQTSEARIKALEDIITGLSFYGSLRFHTFYVKSDSNLSSDSDAVTKLNGTTPTITLPNQRTTEWGLASNSRFGVEFDRGEGIGGKVEIGFRGDNTVTLREGYGTYSLDDVVFLFGQDYTPLSDWDYSNQVFGADNNLLGWGILDVEGKRLPQVKMTWKGLQIALVQNKDASVLNLVSSSTAPSPDLPQLAATSPKAEALLPVLEARYSLKTDLIFGDIFGGYTTYKVKADSNGIDKAVTGYAYGIGGGITPQPVYAKAMIWGAQNGRQMSLHQAYSATSAQNILTNTYLMGAMFDTDYSLINETDMGYALIGGVKIVTVTVEAGYGYVSADKDGNSLGLNAKNKARSYYLNANIPIAQAFRKTVSFFVVPEVGLLDYMQDFSGDKQGKISYAGAKWQINF